MLTGLRLAQAGILSSLVLFFSIALTVGSVIEQHSVVFFFITTSSLNGKQESKSNSEKATDDGTSCYNDRHVGLKRQHQR
jgi:hypothetical protein